MFSWPLPGALDFQVDNDRDPATSFTIFDATGLSLARIHHRHQEPDLTIS
jgi:hypothetical protein